MICTISVRLEDGQRVIAPDPVKAFLRHSKGDDDVHMVPVVLLPGIPECGGDPVPPSGVVVDEVGDPEHAPAGGLHQLKAGLGIRPLPLAQLLDDVLDLPDLVLRALP